MRRQPHRQCHGEEKGFEDRALEIDVHRKDGEHEKKGHLQQEVAEAPHTALEFGLRRPYRHTVGNATEFGLFPNLHDHRTGLAAHDMRPQKQAVRPLRQGNVPGKRRRRFFDRIGLTRQRRLVDEEILGLQKPRIGRKAGAGGQFHDIARHDRIRRHLDHLTIPPHASRDLHKGQQPGHGARRAILLPKTQQRTGQDDPEDDQGITALREKQRHTGSTQQNEDDRAAELGEPKRFAESGFGSGNASRLSWPL